MSQSKQIKKIIKTLEKVPDSEIPKLYRDALLNNKKYVIVALVVYLYHRFDINTVGEENVIEFLAKIESFDPFKIMYFIIQHKNFNPNVCFVPQSLSSGTNTIFEFFLSNNKYHHLEALIRHQQFDPNYANDIGVTPLILLAEHNYLILNQNRYIQIFQLLLKNPILNLELKEVCNHTALMAAVLDDNDLAIKLLLKAGCDESKVSPDLIGEDKYNTFTNKFKYITKIPQQIRANIRMNKLMHSQLQLKRTRLALATTFYILDHKGDKTIGPARSRIFKFLTPSSHKIVGKDGFNCIHCRKFIHPIKRRRRRQELNKQKRARI